MQHKGKNYPFYFNRRGGNVFFKTDPESDPDLNLFKYTFISGSMLKTLK